MTDKDLMESDDVVPQNDEAMAEDIAAADIQHDNNQVPMSSLAIPKGHPYGDNSYGAGSKKTLNKLMQGAYGSGRK